MSKTTTHSSAKNNKWSAKHMAVHLLSRRDHGVAELKQKLRIKQYEDNEIEQAIAYCQSNNWLDDLNYARSQIRQNVSRGYGELKIRQQLMHNQVASAVIEQALLDEEQDWFELAKQVAAKKFHGEIAQDQKHYAKQVRFLQSRGFKMDEIHYALPSSSMSKDTDY